MNSVIVCSFIKGTYRYKGWLFEIHDYVGPWPLKKDGDPKKRAGKKFFDMWCEWDKLSDEEKKATHVRFGGDGL